jgi:hypothetical protein
MDAVKGVPAHVELHGGDDGMAVGVRTAKVCELRVDLRYLGVVDEWTPIGPQRSLVNGRDTYDPNLDAGQLIEHSAIGRDNIIAQTGIKQIVGPAFKKHGRIDLLSVQIPAR